MKKYPVSDNAKICVKYFYKKHMELYPNHKWSNGDFPVTYKIFHWLCSFWQIEQVQGLTDYFFKDRCDLAIKSKHHPKVFYHLIKVDYADKGVYKGNLVKEKMESTGNILKRILGGKL